MKAIQRFKTPIIVQEVDILDQTASVKNLEQWIEELDQFNQTPGNGTTRPVFTAEDMAARSYVHKLMESVGLEVKEDNAGNLFGVLPGEDPSLEPVWTGSHIDTVPNGGKYDGIAGVFAGIEALRMIKESGAPHKRSLSANVRMPVISRIPSTMNFLTRLRSMQALNSTSNKTMFWKRQTTLLASLPESALLPI